MEEDKKIKCPTIGRIVYYTAVRSSDGENPSVIRAAIVTGVVDEENLIIDLMIFNPTRVQPIRSIMHGDKKEGHWMWMPYQKDVQKRLEEDKARGAKSQKPNPEASHSRIEASS